MIDWERDPRTLSPWERFIHSFPVDQRVDAATRFIASHTALEREQLRYAWSRLHARPDQLPPAGSWNTWQIRAGRGWGKLLSVDTALPTPTGWTTMGAVQPGDQLLDESGNPTTVTWASDVQYEDSWRITFGDGSELLAHSEHEWVTWTHAERKAQGTIDEALRQHDAGASGPQVRTTVEIRNTLTVGSRRDRNHSIPACQPLNLPLVDLPIDPYVLGAWLGDGDANGGALTGAPDDLAVIRRSFDAAGETTYELRGYPGRAARFRAEGLTTRLRQLGVIHNKHVPALYLRASALQRLALLQGLMDTDGGVDYASFVSFTSTFQELADAVHELVVSLGMVARRDERPVRLNGVAHGTAYRVRFTPTMHVFRLPRKASRCRTTGPQLIRRRHRMIAAIDPVPSIPMRCVTVDSPHALYLAGPSMIPTHNSRTGAETIRRRVEKGRSRLVLLIGQSAADGRDIMVEGESGVLQCHPQDTRPLYEPSKRKLTWPNGALGFVRSAEDPDAIRGINCDLLWGDEPASWKTGRDAWDNAVMSNRRGRPRAILTGTPRPLPWLREIEQDPTTVVTVGATFDNAANLAPEFIDLVIARYAHTRLGRQELFAQYLDDIEGALWTLATIEQHRINKYDPAHPNESLIAHLSTGVVDLAQIDRLRKDRRRWRTVIAVDPPGETADCGIVAGSAPERGIAGRDHAVILADESVAGPCTPEQWGAAVVKAWRTWDAEAVYVESNQGGDMVRAVVQAVDPDCPVRKIRAKPGESKKIRAEPVSALYERGWIHHWGQLPKLEDQQTTWVEDVSDSPDRLDAAVYVVRELLEWTRTVTAKVSSPVNRRIPGR